MDRYKADEVGYLDDEQTWARETPMLGDCQSPAASKIRAHLGDKDRRSTSYKWSNTRKIKEPDAILREVEGLKRILLEGNTRVQAEYQYKRDLLDKTGQLQITFHLKYGL